MIHGYMLELDNAGSINEYSTQVFFNEWAKSYWNGDLTLFDLDKLTLKIYNTWPNFVGKYLNKRMDVRTIDEFQRDLIQNATLERYWSELFCKAVGDQVWPGFARMEHVGIDITGTLILQDEEMGEPDLRIWLEDSSNFLVEWKLVPCLWKETFKKSNLESYVKYESKMVCLHFAEGYKKGCKPVFYSIFEPEDIERMLIELDFGPCDCFKGKIGCQLAFREYQGSNFESFCGDFANFGKKHVING
jgi:hypothetical protein